MTLFITNVLYGYFIDCINWNIIYIFEKFCNKQNVKVPPIGGVRDIQMT